MPQTLQVRTMVLTAVGVGVIYGGLFTLSPLTALCLPILVALTAWAVQEESARERRWVVALVWLAIGLRLAAIAVLFMTAGADKPFASFFGDEEFFKNRTMWRRNVGLGVPIHAADAIYLFDDVGYSSYMFLLAFVQAMVGEAPYGVHVMNMTFYVGGVLIAYRMVRNAYGGVPALLSMTALLFWPSLFVWSISALKEPAYTCVAAIELCCAVAMFHARAWRRVVAGACVVAGALILDSLRRGGVLVPLVGSAIGSAIAIIVPRPRLALAAMLLAPWMVAGLLMVPAVQDRALAQARRGAAYHSGHVGSSGYAYQVIEPRYYRDTGLIWSMPPRDAAQFVVRATVAYFIEPLPWHAESMAMHGYLPEQMVWLFLVAFAAIGVVAGAKRDLPLTAMLVGHACIAVMVVALTSGNYGTLIRHRGFAMPYIAWLAGAGFCEFIRVAASQRAARSGQSYANG